MSRKRTRPATQIADAARESIQRLSTGFTVNNDDDKAQLEALVALQSDILVLATNMNAATGKQDKRRKNVSRRVPPLE